ncbi:TPA: restriction endonuclease subunit S [Streptococcus agalactiae]|nr:restriction endonuclease subunit S [Streptococcus agalactiae]HEM9369682.1 restriction endonuclease subunit S [Streptococcus agalactiae]HEN4349268.1 restriction endonuclease subunit S [Streptococcus agalactiae]HEO1130475.1 restriction endonuclease subunit S [Streptococcus agalactiae]HEO2446034.1 restriction endonuclease subunit S [Streptococcus agalactiae]
MQEVEVPYEIPESWNWVKLRNIGSITSGGTPKSSEPSYYGGNITWITPADMGKQQNNKFFAKSSKKITELGLQKSSAQLISKNSIVYSSRAPIGHINIVTEDYTTNQGCKSITPLLVDLIFLYWLLQFRTKDIILRSSGTTFKEISASGFGDTLLPLPPLAEQKRIVAQIEKALAKVDEYAESYNKLQQLDKEFPDKLKKSILQYAMQGKLVAQSPDDEPVEVLLEKIKAEKQKLYEEGKLKKKDLEELVVTKGDDNSPYGKIPKNWSFLTIKDIFSITTGLSYKKTDLAITKNGVRIIRGGNINPLSFKILDNDYYIDPKFITSETVYLKRNQLLTPVSTSLEHIGKFARIDKDYPNTAAGGFVFQLTPFVSSDVLSKYLLFSLSSPIFYEQLKSITKLSGQALYNIPKTKLNELLVPLAPETEQKRISQRVEQLFEKVNQL